MFTFSPLGEHNCIICAGTACHVKGSERIIQTLSEEYDIEAGETTPDGLFSLTTARCLGSCGLAPVVVFDGEVSGRETPESVVKKAQEIVSAAKDRALREAEAA
jgi:bidirectional [NiFe] hydrogenase diaphorase subunit